MRGKLRGLIAIGMMFVLLTTPVLAEDMQLSATLVYTAEDSFCVNIPEVIVVGEPAQVEAVEMNIAPDKMVHVDLAEPDGYVDIHSTTNSDRTLRVNFRSSEGNELSVTNLSLASFESGEGGTKEFYTYINNPTEAIAGEYTGNVMFNIRCE